MQMGEAHTCTLAPGACTLDTTDHPNFTELTWAQDSPAAPRSQRFPRRPRQKCQRETHLCSSQVQVQFSGRRSLFRRFRTAELDQCARFEFTVISAKKKEETAGRGDVSDGARARRPLSTRVFLERLQPFCL